MENTQLILKPFEAGVRLNSEIMFPLIEAWELSGDSQKAFCAQREIKPATFAYWRKKHQQSQSNFLEFTPEAYPARGSVLRSGKVELELDRNLSTQSLIELVKQLR